MAAVSPIVITSALILSFQFTVKDGTAGDLASAITPKLSYSGSHGGVNVGASIESDVSKSFVVEKNTDVSGWNLR